MQTLASQTYSSDAHETAGHPALMAQVHTAATSLAGAAVNDNSANWTPTLLVQRRRRLTRRANRV